MRQRKATATITLVAVPLVKETQKAVPLTPSAEPPVRTQALESAYEQHIIFFRDDANVLVFHPNGDIIHRGRKVTNDQEILLALQELVSLPVRNGSTISHRLCNKENGRAEESHLIGRR